MSVLRIFNEIPMAWLEANYADIKEELGFDHSDDRLKESEEVLTDEEVKVLRKECVRKWLKEQD